MPLVNQEEIRHLAVLSRLRLLPEEVGRYATQLDIIFQHVDQLRQVDVSAVPPLARVLSVANVVRTDEPASPLPPEELVSFAPQLEHHQFVIPKILEAES